MYSFKNWGLGCLLMAAGLVATAQIPKLPGGIKSGVDKAKGSVPSGASDAGGDVSQKKGSLDATCKLLEDNIAKNAWTEESTRYNIESQLKRLATDIYNCEKSVNPAEKLLAKTYLDKYKGYLGTYQEKVDLGAQQIDPPLEEAKQKQAHEAFSAMSYAMRQLKNTDKEPKSKWGEQAFVDNVKKNVDQIKAEAPKYLAADADNYAKVERYQTAAQPYEKLWNERKELPAKRDKSTEFLNGKSNAFYAIKKAEGTMEDHDAYLKANEEMDWVKSREHVNFMNEWTFKPSGNYVGASVELLSWVNDYPAKIKADLNKQIADAKGLTDSEKYDFSKWKAAERHLSLVKSAALIYPETAGNVAGAQSLLDDRYKKYEAATFTSDYHKQHVGSVGVSMTGAVGFKALTGFKAGDKAVLTVFLDRPVELFSKEGLVRVHIEGIWDEEEDVTLGVPAADWGKAYVDIPLLSAATYNEKVHEAEEVILRELCMAEGKSVQAKFGVGGSLDGKAFEDLKCSFDGTNTTGIAAYRTRWIGLNAKRLATVTVPKAVTSNAGLEADFSKAFMAKYGESDVKAVLKVNLSSPDWAVVRNELTGIIIAREHSAYVVYKRVDGTCRVEGAGFEQSAQEYGKYGPTYWDGVGDNFEIHCANVK